MNKGFFIGNLTKDPESRTTQSGISLCNFTIAVNRRQGETDFVRVTAWRQLGQNCMQYLTKGKKVAVTGIVSASAYTGSDGKPRSSLEVTAEEVEFLSPKDTDAREDAYLQQEREAIQDEQNAGFVEADDDWPF